MGLALSLPREQRDRTECCPHCHQLYIPLRVNAPAPRVEVRAMLAITELVDGCEGRTYQFFRLVFARDEGMIVKQNEMATALRMLPSTLGSLFFRAGLPSPKQYLLWSQLLAMLTRREQGIRGSRLALEVNASSAQSLNRTVRLAFGCTLAQFHERFSPDAFLDHYVTTLVRPYAAQLRALRWPPFTRID